MFPSTFSNTHSQSSCPTDRFRFFSFSLLALFVLVTVWMFMSSAPQCDPISLSSSPSSPSSSSSLTSSSPPSSSSSSSPSSSSLSSSYTKGLQNGGGTLEAKNIVSSGNGKSSGLDSEEAHDLLLEATVLTEFDIQKAERNMESLGDEVKRLRSDLKSVRELCIDHNPRVRETLTAIKDNAIVITSSSSPATALVDSKVKPIDQVNSTERHDSGMSSSTPSSGFSSQSKAGQIEEMHSQPSSSSPERNDRQESSSSSDPSPSPSLSSSPPDAAASMSSDTPSSSPSSSSSSDSPTVGQKEEKQEDMYDSDRIETKQVERPTLKTQCPPCSSETTSESKFMVIGIPTVPRSNADYLTSTLASIIEELPATSSHPLYGQFLFVVVNNLPGEHPTFDRLRQEYSSDPRLSHHFLFIENNNSPKLNSVKNQIPPGYPNVPDDRVILQTLHLVSLFRLIPKISSASYFMVLEDDTHFCGQTLRSLEYMIDLANRRTKTLSLKGWSEVRCSYGMSGSVLHFDDLTVLASYFESGAKRRPPDHLMSEWAMAETPQSKLETNGRIPMAFRYNIFSHHGRQSSLRDSPQDGFPGCFTDLVYPVVFEGEAFQAADCPDDDISPCRVKSRSLENESHQRSFPVTPLARLYFKSRT